MMKSLILHQSEGPIVFARAQAGIVIGSGTDIAIKNAEVRLVKGDLCVAETKQFMTIAGALSFYQGQKP